MRFQVTDAVRMGIVVCALATAALVSACRPSGSAGAPEPAAAVAGSPETAGASNGVASGAAAVSLDQFEFGGDFALTDHRGQPFSLSDRRGKLGLLFFGYTMCPDVCPMTLSRISQALDALGEARSQVEVYFITVDVDRDTTAVLAKYVEGFGVPITGLRGSREAVDRVVAQYRATYEITPSTSAAGPLVNHTTYTYLLDRQGRIRLLFRHGEPPSTLTAGLRAALAEAAPTTTKAGAALQLARASGRVTHLAAAAIGGRQFAVGYVQAGSPATVWFAAGRDDDSSTDSPVLVGQLDGAASTTGFLSLDINAPLHRTESRPTDALASAIVVQWTAEGGNSRAWRSTDGGRRFMLAARVDGVMASWRAAPPLTLDDEPRAIPPGERSPLSSQRLARPSQGATLLAVGLDPHGALFGTWHEPARSRLAVHRYGYDWTGASNRAEMFDIPVPVLHEGAARVTAAAGAPYKDGALIVWSRPEAEGTVLEGRLVTLDLLCTPPRPLVAPPIDRSTIQSRTETSPPMQWHGGGGLLESTRHSRLRSRWSAPNTSEIRA